MNGFLTRAATAVVFVAVMMGGMLYGRTSYLVLFTLISALCTSEFVQVTAAWRTAPRSIERIDSTLAVVINVMISLVAALAVMGRVGPEWMLGPALLILLFPAIELFAPGERPFVHIGLYVTAVVLIGLPFAGLHLAVMPEGIYRPGVMVACIGLVWIYDAAAYVSGSLVGRTPLFKRHSPKKTVEGIVGGAVILVVIGVVVAPLVAPAVSRWHWLAITLIISVTAVFGDLIESMLKRSLHIKDTGHIMPGHGGFLDRFDAFLYSIPFVTAYMVLFVH